MYQGDAFLELTGGWPSLQQESLPENEDDAGERKGQREIEVRVRMMGPERLDPVAGIPEDRCTRAMLPVNSLVLLKLA